MARLARRFDHTVRPLAARTLVGRSSNASIRLGGPLSSSEHATLSWTGRRWELRDLGSTNGTFLNDERVEPGKSVRLKVGAQVRFGDPQELWVFEDDSAPEAVAFSTVDGHLVSGQGGLLVVPDEAAPQVSVYRNELGEWVAEDASGELVSVFDGSIISADQPYRLSLPLAATATPLLERPALSSLLFRFRVSRDEERVHLEILHRGVSIPIEPRDYHYVLLVLARIRLEECDVGMAERGWVEREQLEKMLAMDQNALNVAVHRARGQLLEAGIEGGQGIVEVSKGRRRFGSDRIEVHPL